MINVPPDNLITIQQILQKFVPDCEVRAFGSRVNGTAKPYSDFDLAIVSKEKIQRKTKMLLRRAFEESKLPFRVDVLDYNAISKEFRTIVDNQYEIIQKNNNMKS